MHILDLRYALVSLLKGGWRQTMKTILTISRVRLMDRFFIASLICFVFLLSGCVRRYNAAVVKNNPYRVSIRQDLQGDWLNTYRLMPQGTAAEQSAKKDRRNQIISELVWLSDDAYYQWEPAFYTSGATVATFFDFASLGLTGGSAVANSPKVLGAMATGIQGANGSITKNFFDQQSRSVIVQKMRQLREAALVRIEAGEDKPVADYSLDQGIVDVQNYYYSGTVTGALQGLASATANQSTENKKDLDAVRNKRTPARVIQP